MRSIHLRTVYRSEAIEGCPAFLDQEVDRVTNYAHLPSSTAVYIGTDWMLRKCMASRFRPPILSVLNTDITA